MPPPREIMKWVNVQLFESQVSLLVNSSRFTTSDQPGIDGISFSCGTPVPRDIPVGLLHLIPLGLAKHLVKYIVDSVDNNTLKKMSAHLDAVVPGGRFFEFFKYMQSRQGKDFKYYLQIAPFNMMFAGVPQKYVKMISCLSLIYGELWSFQRRRHSFAYQRAYKNDGNNTKGHRMFDKLYMRQMDNIV
uniref:Uncharacterized protein n=1 Tax=Magallana gigas TaxID=29159 RepID=K1R5U1_MAGGI